MKKTLRNITAGVVLGACSLIPIKNANAQLSGSIDAVISSKHKKSYMRPCLSYNLPWGVNGFSFLEFYKNANEGEAKPYYGRTKLTKEVIKGLGLRVDATHGSGGSNTYGAGLNVNLPKDKILKNLYLTPFWVNGKLQKVENKTLAGYFASTKLPFGLEASSFGEWNLNGKDGVGWTYGEINIEKKFNKGKFSVAYNPALKNKGAGKPIPRLEHRVTARYYFK
jgi:hypothetical protein